MIELVESLDCGVLKLVLNRPERLNALTIPMTEALLASLRRAASSEHVRVVVLTGAGRAFCAGGDVKAMASGERSQGTLEERAYQLREHMECSRLLHEMPKPTIAVARGGVAGAGLSLALACDIFLASDNVKITSAFAKVGLSGDFGSTYFLSKLLGPNARRFMMMSPTLKAEEALKLGIVSQVVPDDDLDALGSSLAKSLAEGPRIALAHIKANLNCAEGGATLSELLEHESIRHIRCSMTEDHQEAATAFAEHRLPKFGNS